MTRNHLIFTFLMAAALPLHAHASQNLCPAGTKGATLFKESKLSEFRIEPPPITGAFENNVPQMWDITGEEGPFKVACNPDEEGFDNETVHDVPEGSNACIFIPATGTFTCTP